MGSSNPVKVNSAKKPIPVEIAPATRNGVRPMVPARRSDHAPISGSQKMTQILGSKITSPPIQAGIPSIVVMKTGSRAAGMSRNICAPV